jgi:DNA primase
VDNQIEEIKRRVDILDLVSEYVTLKKSGRNYKGLCPFHTEKTPSFMVNPERGIFKCFGCFPPGQIIKTPFGYHSVEAVVESEFVVSGKGEYRKILATHEREYDGDLVTLITRKIRRPVSLTGDHTVLAIRPISSHENRYHYFSKSYRRYLSYLDHSSDYYFRKVERLLPIREIEARNLKKGDLLLYPINDHVTIVNSIDLASFSAQRNRSGGRFRFLPPLDIGEDLLKLLGYWIVGGSNDHDCVKFSLGNHDEEFAWEIVNLLYKVFGAESSILRCSSGKYGNEVISYHLGLSQTFENLCGDGAENKHIPFVLQELDPKFQRVLLEAICKGESHISSTSVKVNRRVTTSSKILSEQIIDILLRLGYFPSLSIGGFSVVPFGVSRRESYIMNWSDKKKPKYNLVYHSRDGQRYWMLPIAEVVRGHYQGVVHNLTVDTDHSYVASHFAVSNCGKGGDLFKFLEEVEGFDFSESLKVLAKRSGIELKSYQPTAKAVEREKVLSAQSQAAKFYQTVLLEHSAGKPALEYLQKRGLKISTIKEWGLGYAPNQWELVTKALVDKGYSSAEIVATGLGVPSDKKDRPYDRFRGRIMFPIRDITGRVVGFSGRILGIGEPKYMNSPDSVVYQKSKILYGMDLAKNDIKKQNLAVLVEGNLDVISSYQSGVKNVVAPMGTALTIDQVGQLMRFAETSALAFDMDLAGDAATRRGIDIAEDAGLNIRVVHLSGKDPDEVIQDSAKMWADAVARATPIYDFYLDSAFAKADAKLPEGKRKIAKELLPVLRKITDPILRGHYLKMVARKLLVEERYLEQALNKIELSSGIGGSRERNVSGVSRKSRQYLLEEEIVKITLELRKRATLLIPDDFTEEKLAQIYKNVINAFPAEGDGSLTARAKFDTPSFAETLPNEAIDFFDEIILKLRPEEDLDEQLEEKVLIQAARELRRTSLRRLLQKLGLMIKQAQASGQETELEKLNKKFRRLSEKLANLEV